MENETQDTKKVTENLQMDPLLEALCGEIEIAWRDEGDDSRVDQLAAAHPELSEELYDFLADLIEVELARGEHDAASEEFGSFVRHWLENGGYDAARSFARNEMASSSSITSDPAPPSSTSAEILPFVGMLRSKTGLATRDVAERIGRDDVSVEFLTLVSRYPTVVPTAVCDELIQRVIPLGVTEHEARSSLRRATTQLAALRQGEFPTEEMSFELLLKRANLRAKAKKYWIALALKGE